MADPDDGTSKERFLPANDNVGRGVSALTEQPALTLSWFIGRTTITANDRSTPANDNCPAAAREP
jgi:hypothetical protein